MQEILATGDRCEVPTGQSAALFRSAAVAAAAVAAAERQAASVPTVDAVGAAEAAKSFALSVVVVGAANAAAVALVAGAFVLVADNNAGVDAAAAVT